MNRGVSIRWEYETGDRVVRRDFGRCMALLRVCSGYLVEATEIVLRLDGLAVTEYGEWKFSVTLGLCNGSFRYGSPLYVVRLENLDRGCESIRRGRV